MLKKTVFAEDSQERYPEEEGSDDIFERMDRSTH